jgi:hypothetical protein
MAQLAKPEVGSRIVADEEKFLDRYANAGLRHRGASDPRVILGTGQKPGYKLRSGHSSPLWRAMIFLNALLLPRSGILFLLFRDH